MPTSAVLMAASFPVAGWPVLAFVAWVPMLYAIQSRPTGVFWPAYAAMALYNLLTTWWIWNAHWSGVVATLLINGALMASIWWGYSAVYRQLGRGAAALGLPFFWIFFVRFHQDWALSFPWLTHGNLFATVPEWIQWYA